MKRVVYTVISGNYDSLWEPRVPAEGVDYLCFTDNPDVVSKNWTILPMPESGPGEAPVVKNRRFKMLPHRYLRDYDQSLYVDGNVSIENDVSVLFDQYLTESDLAIPKHHLRNCLYDEAEACIAKGKGNANEIKAQVRRYQELGFPRNYGLNENNVILRNHMSPPLQTVMEDWFEEFVTSSKRDQLGLSFHLWKNHFSCATLFEGPRETDQFFRVRLHCHEQGLPWYKRVVLEEFMLRPKHRSSHRARGLGRK